MNYRVVFNEAFPDANEPVESGRVEERNPGKSFFFAPDLGWRRKWEDCVDAGEMNESAEKNFYLKRSQKCILRNDLDIKKISVNRNESATSANKVDLAETMLKTK